ncbi:protein c-Fos-like [Chiloscyllium punctatum]|uniref:Protein c-Fos n=1 Tax=Chiloscyllium punctatum TaxID=137246 RepID=A0A401RJT1_CHIPU|nr:hypothetical protein [Chiloscyllium punctatum]
MFQAFSTEYDSASRCSNSPSIGDPFYFSPADSFSSLGSPARASDAGSELAPSLTALSRRPELQWMVQPTLSPGSRHDYSPGAPYRARLTSRYSGRRGKTDQLSPEDEEKRKVRRERNKLAAAKCRNRRRELTDSLQTETEKLEGAKSVLETEIAELLKEKEKLEFILAAHRPVCRLPDSEALGLPASSMGGADSEPEAPPAPAPGLDTNLGADLLSSMDTGRSVPDVDLINLADWEPLYSSLPADCEPLCTPVLPATPSGSYSSSFAFSYPELAECGSSLDPVIGSDHSSDSLNSPTLLAL